MLPNDNYKNHIFIKKNKNKVIFYIRDNFIIKLILIKLKKKYYTYHYYAQNVLFICFRI